MGVDTKNEIGRFFLLKNTTFLDDVNLIDANLCKAYYRVVFKIKSK